jgi:hypothetical protein
VEGTIALPGSFVKSARRFAKPRLPGASSQGRIWRHTVVEVLSDGISKCLLAHAEVVLGRRLNVLVPGQLFDQRNVDTVVPKIGAIGVTKNVRG